MDAVMDLTSRAVSFVTLIQNVLVRYRLEQLPAEMQEEPVTIPGQFSEVFAESFFKNFPLLLARVKMIEKNYQRKRAVGLPANGMQADAMPGADMPATTDTERKMEELVWMSKKELTDINREMLEKYTVKICFNLVEWIIDNRYPLEERIGANGVFKPPAMWRDAISELIYRDSGQRIALAEALEYLPIHVVLALGAGKYDAAEQRILQCWIRERRKDAVIAGSDLPLTGHTEALNVFVADLMSKQEFNLHEKFTAEVVVFFSQEVPDNSLAIDVYDKKIRAFLADHRVLGRQLLKNGVPFTFEYVFNQEIDEILAGREMRRKELEIASGDGNSDGPVDLLSHLKVPGESCDPFVRSSEMELFAACFSGGGIRSATFNLGLLQGLAKSGFISRIDYLSTVSGGGYIGSWLASWIKREGSVYKVADRLNPEKTTNPMGEEVRPIRWLRMFSNYFSPDKSIMSIDSWTVGVTWLRNTLLNQVVIFSLLFSLLILTRLVFICWNTPFWDKDGVVITVSVASCILLLLVAILTGSGMQWYSGRQSRLPFQLHSSSLRSTLLILVIAVIGSFLVSTVMYVQPKDFTFVHRVMQLRWAGVVMFAVLLFVALTGKYHRCLEVYNRNKFLSYTAVVFTALVSAVLGLVALALCWKLLHLVKIYVVFVDAASLAFTIGPAMVLMVFGIMVVARMALLGKYFPDERREWWGRMGASINKWAFIWIIIAGATLLMGGILTSISKHWNVPATVGGWMALIGVTVKSAFNGNISGSEKPKGFKVMLMSLLGMAGPYLFILGLLIFLPDLIDPLLRRNIFPGYLQMNPYAKLSILFGGFFGIGSFLSWKLGVNEFSMHHFYKNRLVRAFLGATKRKSDRERTVNPFTGFDKLDDEKLARFTHCQGYSGPYPVLNAALNATQLSDLSRQDRKAESFIFSPLFCGYDFSRIRSLANPRSKTYDYGLRPTGEYAYRDGGPAIGTAMAISGAAVNPNQGYHSSVGTAFLLTVFNVQMGWWIGNPRKSFWQHSDPDFALPYLFSNLVGQSSTKDRFVCLSDGGHFDNMGLYEMVRRRCKFILVSDAEQDEDFRCEGFATAIRCCRIDFGAIIDIKIDKIINRRKQHSQAHFAVGTIHYSGEKNPTGTILYIKSSISGNEPVDVTEYASQNPSFPHQTTADQFFDESQFESYRTLGMHIGREVLKDKAAFDALNLGVNFVP